MSVSFGKMLLYGMKIRQGFLLHPYKSPTKVSIDFITNIITCNITIKALKYRNLVQEGGGGVREKVCATKLDDFHKVLSITQVTIQYSSCTDHKSKPYECQRTSDQYVVVFVLLDTSLCSMTGL